MCNKKKIFFYNKACSCVSVCACLCKCGRVRVCASVCVGEEERRWFGVQGSCSSLGHLQYGMLGEDKADGSSPVLWGRPSADSLHPPYPPRRLSRLQAQKRGGHPAWPKWGTGILVWTQQGCCSLSQLGRQTLNVCVSFLRLWNAHCRAQEVAIQIIYADSCRPHKVGKHRIIWWRWGESGGMDANYHCWNSSKYREYLWLLVIKTISIF